MTKHDAIKHLSYKIAYYKGIEEKWADSVSIDALKIAVRAMAEERKKGEWINEGFYGEGHSQCSIRCSNPLCNFHFIGYITDYNYCPHCGSYNREEKTDEQTNRC